MDPIQAEPSYPPSPLLGRLDLPDGLQHFTSPIIVQTSPLHPAPRQPGGGLCGGLTAAPGNCPRPFPYRSD
ncbi:hypothetical protein ACFL3Q_14250 [Planctomycetota bacterium]